MIEVRQGGVYYTPDDWIFRRYSFTLEQGEVLAILGPNGRGKTTLLKSLVGLIPLDEGDLRVGAELGYVPQQHQIAFAYSVLDVVLMGRARHVGLFSTPARADLEAARSALARLGIAHFAERAFDRLSSGEQQLVLIARALASGCQLLVLDEPTASLDFKNQQSILRTLRQISANENMTVAFATHVPQHAAVVADQALLMYGPHEYLFGPTETVMTDRNLSRLYELDVRSVTIDHGDRDVTTVVPMLW